jgi:hypothetical protein
LEKPAAYIFHVGETSGSWISYIETEEELGTGEQEDWLFHHKK